GWTVDRLRKEVQGARGGPRRKGGRRRRSPKSFGPGVDLRELLRVTDQWLAANERVWSAEGVGLLAPLPAMPEEQYTAELAEQLGEAEGRLEELVRQAQALKGRLERLREKVRQAQGGRHG